MDDANKKMSREYVQTTLNNIFVWAMEGVRFVRMKLPIRSADNSGYDGKIEVVLSDAEMSQIFTLLKRGANRVCSQHGTTPIFEGINDHPDPEAEFDKQLFEMQAELLDKAGSEENVKEKVALVRAVSDLINTKKRLSIRKLDLKLALALAKKLDPTVTEQQVIDILKFESERL